MAFTEFICVQKTLEWSRCTALCELTHVWVQVNKLLSELSFESRKGKTLLLVRKTSRPALEPAYPRIQWVLGDLSPGLKRLVREANHSPPSSVEMKNTCNYTLPIPYAFTVCGGITLASTLHILASCGTLCLSSQDISTNKSENKISRLIFRFHEI